MERTRTTSYSTIEENLTMEDILWFTQLGVVFTINDGHLTSMNFED